ncbi:three prime repair exonuclease 2-like [Physella acuta]|uniref:three prime repair exonuclease 2-like n=1 Tax=Physella acuta TaxID=109671 RepID=UPI0027DB17DC|nr:three prime repair exonuclease 2-like [Physella acuta]
MQAEETKTVVIFDTETTGLPTQGNKIKMTELCFIAISREELNTKAAPRVLNKLTLCFNPKRRICHEASKISRLHNDALEGQKSFACQADLISTFLTSLPQPVCLVAHNGNRFDYPLLVSEYLSAKKDVPKDILCVDSLEAFRAFDGLDSDPRKRKLPASSICQAAQDDQVKNLCNTASPNKQTKLETGCWNVQEHTPPSTKICVTHPSPKFFEPPDQKARSLTVRRKLKLGDDGPAGSLNLDQAEQAAWDNFNGSQFDADSFYASSDDHSLLEAAESAEQLYFSPENQNNSADQRKMCNDQTEMTADLPTYTSCEQSNVEGSDTTAGQEIPTQLENLLENFPKPQHENGDALLAKNSQKKPEPKHVQSNVKKSYKLSDIYFYLFNQQPPDCHTAEGDCLTLLSIIKQKAELFCRWCDEKAVPLTKIGPLY